MQINNPILTKIIGQNAKNIDHNIKVNDEEWQMCYRENTTYIDCPINSHTNESLKMIIAIFNPSNMEQ